MATDFTGITNFNEYFTNHYFSSYLSEDISKIITNLSSKELEKPPWSKLRDLGKQYSQIHDKMQSSRNFQVETIPELAASILRLLDYPDPNGDSVSIEGESIPVYATINDLNNNLRLIVLLSVTSEENGLLDGQLFSTDILGGKLYSKADCSSYIDSLFFKNSEPPRWCLVIGLDEIALIDRKKWGERKYISIDLETLFGRHEDSTLKAVCAFLHSSSLIGKDGSCALDELLDNSRRNASGVSDDLKYALRESIEILGNEVIYYQVHNCNRDVEEDPIDAEQLTLECLRYMYRMLFVLFIESRPELGYAPMSNLPYFQGYSLESLRDIAESVRGDIDNVADGYYLHDTLSKLYEIIYSGYPSEKEDMRKLQEMESISNVFVLEPLKAHIFDPEYTSVISSSRLRNSSMLKIIDLMSVTRPNKKKNTRRGRISYSALGINQMGAVYEALLSYRGFIAEDKLYEVKPADDNNFDELSVGYFVKESELDLYAENERVRHDDGSLRCYEKGTFIYRLAGREREKSASYYTPESLTKTLVKYSLKELLEGKSADEIIDLTICEPAMGSAAFLNEAINQLAEAYISKKQEETGKTIPYDIYQQELQRVKMYIADKNVYGVDLNPVAVELAEVSLWLNTIFKGGYIPWFGTQLVNGNSLIGARRQCYRIEELQAEKEPAVWYSHKPERILPKSSRNIKKQIYHFLTSDPGMSNYTDKVIKSLYPDEIKKLNTWRKKFTSPYSETDIQTMLNLSSVIDDLWSDQVKLREDINKLTSDTLSVWEKEDTIHDSHTTIREKDKIYRDTYLSEKMQNAGPYARLKFAMDYWCALWFWPIDKVDLIPTREQFLFDMSYILSGVIGNVTIVQGYKVKNKGNSQSPNAIQTTLMPTKTEEAALALMEKYKGSGIVDLQALCEKEPRLAVVRDISRQFRFMHWELEFADVFEHRGGFDLIVGNPPWIKLEWNEQNVLSDYYPQFVIKKYTASETTKKRTEALSNEYALQAYLSEYVSTTGMQNYYNSSQNYAELKGVQTNLYKCFIPQATIIVKTGGLFSFVHPDGIFNDPSGNTLRNIIYPKLKQHYHFVNEKLLFADVGHPSVFSLNIYQNSFGKAIKFKMIANLFDPSTIDQCYSKDDKTKLMGIKDEQGNWNIVGHPDRVLTIDDQCLKAFALLFDESDYRGAHLLVLHNKQLLETVKRISILPHHLSEKEPMVCEMWHESYAQDDGTMAESVSFPEQPIALICSGPHISVSNPLFKTPRAICKEKGDYDVVPLKMITDDYLPRTKYIPNVSLDEYVKRSPTTPWDTKYIDSYRLVARKMLNLKQERTLNCSIIPPNVGHMNGIVGFCFKDDRDALTILGTWSSIPFDFLIKAIAKTNLNMDNASGLPTFSESPLLNEVRYRALKLNSLTKNYDALIRKFNFGDTLFEWTKDDSRLSKTFSVVQNHWTTDYPLRTDFERRQALIEIDVLVSMLLGITLDQLYAIYETQFPVLKMYDDDTWYDANGMIVHTNNRGISSSVGISGKQWDDAQSSASDEITVRTEMDYTPQGLQTVELTYSKPFTKANRKEDYRIAWEFFTDKYGVKR